MNMAYNLTDEDNGLSDGPFRSDQEIRRIGEGLLDHSLPREDWTHAAHCAAALYFMLERPDLDLRRRMPLIIRSYNIATGVMNTRAGGYHETTTQFYLRLIAQFVSVMDDELRLHEVANFFMRSPFSKLDYVMLFYSPERLFSDEARRHFVEPDIRPFPA